MVSEDASTNSPQEKRWIKVLSVLLCSENFRGFLTGFSRMVNFTIHIYNDAGSLIMDTGVNPLCKLIESSTIEIDCPMACKRLMHESMEREDISIYKCSARVVNFTFPIKRLGERVIITGRNSFATYEDLTGFLMLCKDKNILDIPIDKPIIFHDSSYTLNTARYLKQAINCILDGIEEREGLDVKLKRLTSILDNRTFEAISANREMMYIYILDTIEFILGNTSTAIMTLEEDRSTYKTLYSTGRHKDSIKGLRLSHDNPVIKEILSSRSPVYPVNFSRLSSDEAFKGIGSVYLFPIFITDEIEGLICIFDRGLTSEEIKIIRAFRDYIQITLENQGLRLSINKKSDEILSSLLDISRAIAPLLDTEHLFHTILEKSIQLLNAEQGSLMLLDHDTSELLIEARKGLGDIVKEKTRLKKDECIAARVIDTGKPLLVDDIERHSLIKRPNRPHYKTKSFISMPIKIEDRVEGVINVSDKIDGSRFNEYDLKILESFTASASIAIQRSLFYKQTEKLKELSITDPLTGLYNRRHINERIKEEITRFKRYKHPFSFLMLDIDGFKTYNDTYGHIKGDEVLKALADTITESLRTIDIAGRFGGDEFVVILSQTPKVDAISIANRLRENVNNRLMGFTPDRSMRMTISMGITTFPDDTSSLEDVLKKTDEALYLAKRGGGNRVSHL
ncbi:MAG: hypothetical protein Fur0020_04230 [Thermodesulfovibrionia bacterium]